jgi:UDPglucose 6-dehydrogenase
MEPLNIGIFGSGVVGFATGRGLIDKGHKVKFLDVSPARVEALRKQGYDATLDPKEVVLSSELVFIIVPTPSVNESVDLSYIEVATANIGKALKIKKGYTIIIPKSTIPPLTCEQVIIPLLEQESGLRVGKDFGLVFNPEFLRENYAYEDFVNPDRIVVGEYDQKSGDLVAQMYSEFGCPVVRTNLRTAEIIKYANNNFYSLKISFFNELKLVCDKAGIDSNKVREIVQMDRYYPTHPTYHGKSFGGKCLPKDLDGLIEFARKMDVNPEVLKAVRNVNYAYQKRELEAKPEMLSPVNVPKHHQTL